MKTKSHILLSLTLLALFSASFLSCTRDDDDGVVTLERPKINRTIDYTVLVVAGETAASASSGSYYKSAQATTGATGATVQVSVGGKVLSKTTDISGQATFTKLVAGVAAVTVSLENHTTCNFTVDLYHIDTILYDNEKQRIASTKVILFPTTGNGMITVTGLVNLQSDVTVTYPAWAVDGAPRIQNDKYEVAPAGTVVSAVVENSQFGDYVSMDNNRLITNITYEGLNFSGSVDATGNYSITVPSTAMGLNLKLSAASVATNVSYSASQYDANGIEMVNPTSGNPILLTKTQRNVFSTPFYTVTAYTNQNQIVDLTYSNPTIIDPDYVGGTAYTK
jgi:hypothetical protein